MNEGFSFFNFNYDLVTSNQLYDYVRFKNDYRFFTDTCGCDKMFVWKMPKTLWKYQKERLKSGKISELPPQYIVSSIKPPRYDLYKINTKNYGKENIACDTLSNFCKIIAKSFTPKMYSWQRRFQYIGKWSLKKMENHWQILML